MKEFQKVGELKTQKVGITTAGERQMNDLQNVGGRKTQVSIKENEGEIRMEAIQEVGELETQNEREQIIKAQEAERIAVIEEKLIGLKLAHKTDSYTIPVTQVNVEDLCVTMQPWASFWEHKKIDLRTPVILGREKNVIGGPFQFFEAQEKGLKQIDAVYIDSLKGKVVSASTLKEQFLDKDICISFAYSLYATLFDELQYIISFSEFCENFDRLFVQEDVYWRTYCYISELDEVFGG